MSTIRDRNSHLIRNKLVLISLAVLVITAAVAGGLWYKQNRATKPPEVEQIIAKVSRLIELPANEEPTLVTVVDKTKVEQPFLRSTENGDKLLIYKDAKKVYIYRPQSDKLIDVGSIAEPVPEESAPTPLEEEATEQESPE